ncbi:MAG: nuclear transport factor 2 family protein, partial [Erythrobacter sp.]|nr:nuclear transport factor 2 family protein [Erythrobacter sp.]
MEAYLRNLDNMLAAWNASDEAEVRQLTETAMEHNVHFVDPNHNIMGREAFITMVRAVQGKIPGAVYSRVSRVDVQNNHCRYHWAIHKGGNLLMSGFDV